MDAKVDAIRARIRDTPRLVIYLGAALSAEADFDEDLDGSVDDSVVTNPPEEMATPDTFRRDPARLWRWYLWRRERIAKVQSPQWVDALSALHRRGRDLSVITENVDGLLEGHGIDVIELHGSLWRTRCLGCNRIRLQATLYADALPPKCVHCMELIRPDVVLYGETLDSKAIERAMRWACTAQTLLVVGTQGLVATSASMVSIAADNGAYVVDLDEEDAPLSGNDRVQVTLRGQCGPLLCELLG